MKDKFRVRNQFLWVLRVVEGSVSGQDYQIAIRSGYFASLRQGGDFEVVGELNNNIRSFWERASWLSGSCQHNTGNSYLLNLDTIRHKLGGTNRMFAYTEKVYVCP
jgi:hypothetical protein